MLPDTLGHLFDVPLRLAPSSVAVIQGDTDAHVRGARRLVQPRGERPRGPRRARGPPRRPHVLERLAVPARVPGPHADRRRLRSPEHPDGGRGARVRDPGRRGDGPDRRPRPGGARPAASRARSRGSPTSSWTRPPPTAPLEWDAWLAGASPRFRRRRHRSGLGLHAAVHLRLDREAQGCPARSPGPDLERGHHPEDGVSRRHRARAGRGAALSQERDDRRGEAVSPRRRVARDPPRLRPRRGHPRHRPPQGDLPHRRAGHVQADARREGDPRAAQRPVHPLRALRVRRGAGGAPHRVPAGLRRADRRVVRPDRGRAGPDGEPALRAQEARLLRRRRRRTARTASSRPRDGVTDCAVDEVGELVTRNPGLAKGFWKLPRSPPRRSATAGSTRAT